MRTAGTVGVTVTMIFNHGLTEYSVVKGDAVCLMEYHTLLRPHWYFPAWPAYVVCFTTKVDLNPTNR